MDKGITVCDEWKDYAKFHVWSLNNGYADDLELDRKDDAKGYSPENCQWVTHKENTLKIRNLFGKSREI